MNLDNIKEKIEKYKDIDLRNVNADDIPDIKSLKIDKRKSKEDRIIDYLNQVENPYVFKVNGRLVQIGFKECNRTAEDCLTSVLDSLYK